MEGRNFCDSDGDAELCVVCCKDILICSIMDCQHTICHECSTRLRVLCDKLECPICRQKTTIALFSSQRGSFRSLYLRSLYTDDRYKLAFEDAEARQAFDGLLAHQCPRCACRRPFGTFKQLQEHVTREHDLFYCDLCVTHLKLFNKERKLYTRELLEHHHQQGDAGDASYSGHPLCNICHQRYIDQEELYLHKRRDHYYCHLCEADDQQLFYGSCAELQAHYRRKHFLCEEGECRDKRLIVFRTNIDLQAHRASSHSEVTGGGRRQGPVLTLEFSAVPAGRRRRADRRGSSDVTSLFEAASSPGTINTESRLEFPSLGGGGTPPGVGPAGLSFNLNRRPAHTNVTINVSRRPATAAAAASPGVGSPTGTQPRISQVSSSGNITMQSPTMEQPPLIRGGRLVSDLESLYRRPEQPPPPPPPAEQPLPSPPSPPAPPPTGPRSYSGTNSVRFSVSNGDWPAAGQTVTSQPAEEVTSPLSQLAAGEEDVSHPGQAVTSQMGQLALGELVTPEIGRRARYSAPENLQARSCRLVKLARDLCRSEETLRTFRQLSAEFRCGQVSGKHYYGRCLALLGNDRLGRLFPELLVLLPDINKQTELLAAHEALNKDGFHRNKFLRCPTCGQILTLSDWGRHSALHCRNAEFPPAWEH